MQPASRHGLAGEPNVVPMIDILLVLLIIFMIATSVQRRALDVQLPQREAGSGAGAPIVLAVTPGPSYAINGSVVAADSLARVIERVYRGRPDKVLFVDGAPTVRYQDVVHAFDVARGAGVRVTGIVPPAGR